MMEAPKKIDAQERLPKTAAKEVDDKIGISKCPFNIKEVCVGKKASWRAGFFWGG